MAEITETAQWETTIREIATTDPVVGGPTGPANIQAQQLANRTAYLKDQITQILAGGGSDGSTVPNATELVAGIIAIATQAETNAGTLDNKAVTPLKLANATSTSIATHEQATDPHPQYLTQPEADAMYPQLGSTVTLDANGNVVQPAGLGVNQTWQDVTANRVLGTVYTNSTGRPILVSTTVMSQDQQPSYFNLKGYIDGVMIGAEGNYSANNGYLTNMTIIVPAYSTYYFTAAASNINPTLTIWKELR